MRSAATVMALFLSRSSGIADELPAVASFELGSFTLHVATRPFRISWYHDGKLLIAERARRVGSSVEMLGDAGWMSLGDVRAIRKEARNVNVVVAVPGSERTVEVRASAGMSLELPGAKGLRDDLTPAPEEVFFASSGSPRLVFSSRGYAIRAGGGGKERVRVFEPDPDALRIESDGPRLVYEIWPATAPKEALRRSARLRAAAPGPAAPPALAAPPAPRAVRSWTELRAAVAESLEASLAGDVLAPIAPAPDLTDADLRARVISASAFLPALYAPPAESRDSSRLEKTREALEPLLAKHAALAKEEGIAALRPLFVEHPGERDAWRARDEWLLGPDVLVAPILKQGAATREVWIPPGEWIDARAKPDSVPPLRGPARVKAKIGQGEIAVYIRREAEASSVQLFEAMAER